MGCGAKPPILKKQVIKKVAFDFCKLDESEMPDDLLQMKGAKTHPVARARIVPVPAQAGKEPSGDEGDKENASSGADGSSTRNNV